MEHLDVDRPNAIAVGWVVLAGVHATAGLHAAGKEAVVARSAVIDEVEGVANGKVAEADGGGLVVHEIAPLELGERCPDQGAEGSERGADDRLAQDLVGCRFGQTLDQLSGDALDPSVLGRAQQAAQTWAAGVSQAWVGGAALLVAAPQRGHRGGGRRQQPLLELVALRRVPSRLAVQGGEGGPASA